MGGGRPSGIIEEDIEGTLTIEETDRVAVLRCWTDDRGRTPSKGKYANCEVRMIVLKKKGSTERNHARR